MTLIPQPVDTVGKISKWAVIFMGVLILALAVAFSARFVKRMDRPQAPPQEELLLLGDKLAQAGLAEQAAEAYRQYLAQSSPPQAEKTRIYLALGKAFAGQKRCADALFWLYRIQVADPEASGREPVRSLIESCKVHPPQ